MATKKINDEQMRELIQLQTNLGSIQKVQKKFGKIQDVILHQSLNKRLIFSGGFFTGTISTLVFIVLIAVLGSLF